MNEDCTCSTCCDTSSLIDGKCKRYNGPKNMCEGDCEREKGAYFFVFDPVKGECICQKNFALDNGVCKPINCGANGTLDKEANKCVCKAGYAGSLCQFSRSDCRGNGNPSADANDNVSCICDKTYSSTSQGKDVVYKGKYCQYNDNDACHSLGIVNDDGTCDCQGNRYLNKMVPLDGVLKGDARIIIESIAKPGYFITSCATGCSSNLCAANTELLKIDDKATPFLFDVNVMNIKDSNTVRAQLNLVGTTKKLYRSSPGCISLLADNPNDSRTIDPRTIFELNSNGGKEYSITLKADSGLTVIPKLSAGSPNNTVDINMVDTTSPYARWKIYRQCKEPNFDW
jgi:hypothetical protein